MYDETNLNRDETEIEKRNKQNRKEYFFAQLKCVLGNEIFLECASKKICRRGNCLPRFV